MLAYDIYEILRDINIAKTQNAENMIKPSQLTFDKLPGRLERHTVSASTVTT